jgi:hypothetical protein
VQKIFEAHIHFPFDMFDAGIIPLSKDEALVRMEKMVNDFVKANVVKACVLGARGEINHYVHLAMERYPELIIGLAYLDMDRQPYSCIASFKEMGFRGLKIINPQFPYSDPRYFVFYAEAERLEMTMLFHTGVVGNEVDYLDYSPFDRKLAERSKEFEKKVKTYASSSAYMLPIFLDTIAQRFPDLKIFGAHLGYGSYDLACAVARFRRNVFFDLSGGSVVKRHILDKQLIKKDISTFKLIYASDGLSENIRKDADGWLESFSELGLSLEEIENIMYLNAARIYGFEEYT